MVTGYGINMWLPLQDELRHWGVVYMLFGDNSLVRLDIHVCIRASVFVCYFSNFPIHFSSFKDCQLICLFCSQFSDSGAAIIIH